MAKSTSKILKDGKMRIVRIVFLDHCHGIGSETELMPCEVFGVLYKETKEAYHVACWIGDGEINENTDTYAIAKCVVGEVQKLGWYELKKVTYQ
jgi:hypothetical protein